MITGRVAAAVRDVSENIVGLGRAKREAEAARAQADAIIDFLHLGVFRERIAGPLPYGVQKRVELASAFVAKPKPPAGRADGQNDRDRKQEMSGFMRAARERFGITVILIEHDIGVVMGFPTACRCSTMAARSPTARRTSFRRTRA